MGLLSYLPWQSCVTTSTSCCFALKTSGFQLLLRASPLPLRALTPCQGGRDAASGANARSGRALKEQPGGLCVGPTKALFTVALLNTTDSLLMLQRLQPFLQTWWQRAGSEPHILHPLPRQQKSLQELHQEGCFAEALPKGGCISRPAEGR